MKIEQIDGGFRATVPCKVNLFLEILGKRADGYHDLDTIMLGVSLCDELSIHPTLDSHWDFSVSFADASKLTPNDPAWQVPSDEKNLVLKALGMLAKRIGNSKIGGKVHLHKSIPAMAGLGGGSANAAAALVLGYLAFGKSAISWSEVCDCASELGSDVNFFLEGCNDSGIWLARCSGRGECIEPLPSSLDALALVLIHPPSGCSTGEVFSRYQNSVESNRSPERLVSYLANDESKGVGEELFNALEIPAEEVTEWISRARRWIDRYDHFGQALSGSGSSRFCLCASVEQAEIMVKEMKCQNMFRVYAVRPWQQPSLAEQLKAINGLC